MRPAQVLGGLMLCVFDPPASPPRPRARETECTPPEEFQAQFSTPPETTQRHNRSQVSTVSTLPKGPFKGPSKAPDHGGFAADHQASSRQVVVLSRPDFWAENSSILGYTRASFLGGSWQGPQFQGSTDMTARSPDIVRLLRHGRTRGPQWQQRQVAQLKMAQHTGRS